MQKIISTKNLKNLVEKLRRQNKKIVTCNGCFDILHIGHIKFLKEAKKKGDVLIVGLNSDSSVKKLKGRNRPVNEQNTRAEMLAALEIVDYVTIFSETTPIKLITIIKPDVHVNGEEYGLNCIEAPTVKKHGGKIFLVKKIKNFSTTSLIKKLKT